MQKPTQADIDLIARLKDPKFFIERFLWITDKQQTTVPFLFNLPQNIYYKSRTLFDLILKARKEGFSSLIEAIWLHACMFFENEKAVTMAQNQDETKIHHDRVDFFLKNMGTKHIKWEVELGDQNQREIFFPATNSRYWLGTAGAKSFGRSRDVSRFHGTEVAHYEDQSVLTGVLNACIPNAWRVLETTANGVGEKFHELWEEAEDPQSESPWTPHFFGWHQDPTNRIQTYPNFKLRPEEVRMKKEYKLDDEQVHWYRKMYAMQTEKEKMKQENPSKAREAFLSSGRHIFSLEKLEIMFKRCVQPLWIGELEDDLSTIRLVENPEGRLSVWKNRRDQCRYLIAADVSEGVKDGAWSVAAVFDRASWEMVAEFRARMDPGRFGDMLCLMGEFFNWAIVAPEMNNHGHATLEAMKAKSYPHILKTTDLWPGDVMKLGFPTDERTKGKIISALRNAIDAQNYIENSKVAIREMMRAVADKDGKMVSEGGFLDCVITRGIGLYCLKFLTLDETYREKEEDRSPVMVTSIVSKPKGRGGYR